MEKKKKQVTGFQMPIINIEDTQKKEEAGNLFVNFNILKYNIKFEIGEIVYLKTDPEQHERFIIGIYIRQNGTTYGLSHLTNESWHCDFEITRERDIVKATS